MRVLLDAANCGPGGRRSMSVAKPSSASGITGGGQNALSGWMSGLQIVWERRTPRECVGISVQLDTSIIETSIALSGVWRLL
jgi:hypothetical protein